eukprot:gene16369-biopygen17249
MRVRPKHHRHITRAMSQPGRLHALANSEAAGSRCGARGGGGWNRHPSLGAASATMRRAATTLCGECPVRVGGPGQGTWSGPGQGTWSGPGQDTLGALSGPGQDTLGALSGPGQDTL